MSNYIYVKFMWALNFEVRLLGSLSAVHSERVEEEAAALPLGIWLEV